jgi:hypothetical protein
MSYDAHDTAVMVRVNRFIRLVNSKYPDSTIAEKLEFAWAANIKEREEDSTNTIGRDADYYFAARKELATVNFVPAKMAMAVGGNVAWLGYAIRKVGSEVAGHPEWTRTDPDKPNAPVGGIVWMNRGSSDGLAEVGDRVTEVRLHYETIDDGPTYSPVKRGTT